MYGMTKGKKSGEMSIPIDINVGIADFGPIEKGNISLKPLTIFLGSNNSGKSYGAMLIHSIFESCISSSNLIKYPSGYRSGMIGRQDTKIKRPFAEIKKFTEELITLEHDQELWVPSSIIDTINRTIMEEIFENRLSSEIIRSFSAPLDNLIRIGKNSFSINIRFNDIDIHLQNQKDRLKLINQIKSQIKIKFKVSEKLGRSIYIKSHETENEIIINKNLFENKDLSVFRVSDILYNICMEDTYNKFARVCYYLPAARSGILQGHKALMANIVEKIPFVGIEKIDLPKFSGVVSDFLSSIIRLPDKKGVLYDMSEKIEREIIEGTVIIRTFDRYSYHEIMYNFQDTDIPLHRASSTVSELAPLFLYLKYLVEPGSILIIEEPEAHLHPKNQRILSRLIVKLIRNNVNVLITTHSEYLLEQLSNFIGLSKIDSSRRAELFKYDENDILNPDEVCAYLFRRDANSEGSIIDTIEVTDSGISQDEFIKVHEILYSETITIDDIKV